ncbi:MAG: 1-acyl-sn-glycerol-3-phosphate acyltransferase [Faecousia sp.]
MKTTVREMDFEKVMALPHYTHLHPRKPNLFWRTLIRGLTVPGLAGTGFSWSSEGMEGLGKDEPCLILMNHSCFLDLQIAYRILYPRAFNIICTSDGFVGMGGLMAWLMRTIGCVPTQKFVTDLTLVQDISYCLKTLKTSVLMYPEASYSFDGTCTPLPRKMGVLLKKLDVPVVMIETFGAFSRNPLYNELQVRKHVPVSAKVRLLYTREELREKTVKELSDGLDDAFSFDHFRWQKENGVEINDGFRADGLNRILYKCPCCGAEGEMRGEGTTLTCRHCGKRWELTALGELKALEGQTEFSHIPDWYRWEREQVRRQLLDGSYALDIDVDIAMLVDFKAIYKVGQGHLTHGREGFTLTGCGGRLHYTQKPTASYGLYADYYWYEIADTICIGDNRCLYYCFPKGGDVVARTRLAAEELYKLCKSRVLTG